MIRALGSVSCDISYETRATISYHIRDRALVSISCDIVDETGVTICYGHWKVRLVITLTGKGVRYVMGYHSREKSMVCYGHWVLRLVISFTRQEVRFVTGIGFCLL